LAAVAQRYASGSAGALLFVLLTLLLAVPAEIARCETIRVGNSGLQVGIDSQRGALTELIDRKSGQNLLAGTIAESLWELDLEGLPVLTSTNAGVFKCERPDHEPRTLKLTWSDFDQPASGLCVEAIVRLDPALPLSRWSLRVSGLTGRVLREARFPRVRNLARQPDERLAVPVWMGQLAENPRRILAGGQGAGTRLEWAYPGFLSLQCLAFYAEGGLGLYVACEDTAAFRKEFAVLGDKEGNAHCEVAHLPEHRSLESKDWEMPYNVVLGTFRGDWVTAAEQYRSWAEHQVWAKESRLARGLVPEWVLNTGLWVWNRGRSEGVINPALELQRRLNLPVSVFWHWWHGCSYDTGFPEYLPPREGTESFSRALNKAHEHDVHAIVYMNQRLWGMTTRSWTNEGAERFAVKGPDGKLHAEVYNTFTKAPCAPMCMGTDFWRAKYAGLAERAIGELGVDGIYMDQACATLACYDRGHGHPIGGGKYWMEGFRSLESDIRRRCAHLSTLAQSGGLPTLAGEGCGEPWLPYLDLMLSLQVSKERYSGLDGWQTIPFFHAVYHAYAVTYGNYSSLTMPPYDDLWPAEFAPKEPLKLLDRKFSRQFLMEQARAFVWGQQPTIANFLPEHFEQRQSELDYFMRLAKIRAKASKYLLRGTFLRPPSLNAPVATLDMSRLSIYAGQQGGLTEFKNDYPLVLAGAWRAPDGAVGIALASIADEPVALSLELDLQASGISPDARVSRLEESGKTHLGKIQHTNRLSVNLPPRGACVLELTDRPNSP
jgi:hypothetical protein